LLHTTGELCVSPIGLSMVTKLADEKETGLAMGGWFLSIAMAQYVAGIIAAIASGGGGHGAALSGIDQYADTYMQLFWLGLVFGIVYLVAAPFINKLMHGVK
jgi:POT family proton-dependent oligopeptide transporter